MAAKDEIVDANRASERRTQAEVVARIAASETRTRMETRGVIVWDGGAHADVPLERAPHAAIVSPVGRVQVLIPDPGRRASQIRSILQDRYKYVDPTRPETPAGPLTTTEFLNLVRDTVNAFAFDVALIDNAAALAWIEDREQRLYGA